MSNTFKPIDTGGRNIRTFYVHKTYNITTETLDEYFARVSQGISGRSGSYIRELAEGSLGPTNSDGTHQFCLYSSMHQEYYTTHSVYTPDYKYQIKIPVSQSDTISVISISKHTFGSCIQPGTLSMTDLSSSVTIIDDSNGNLIFKYPDSFPTSAPTFSLTLGGVTAIYTTASIIGNVFYEHGIALVMNGYVEPSRLTLATGSYNSSKGRFSMISQSGAVLTGSAGFLFTGDGVTTFGNSYDITFKNTVSIREHEYMCTVKAGEMNTTTNPTACDYREDGILLGLKSFVTHSAFNPYITTIGLYNDSGDLIAVAKMARPIKNINYLDYTFIVRFDA